MGLAKRYQYAEKQLVSTWYSVGAKIVADYELLSQRNCSSSGGAVDNGHEDSEQYSKQHLSRAAVMTVDCNSKH